jgi:predicted nucleic acid-binding protein
MKTESPLTYLDACVLIAAVRGNKNLAAATGTILGDANRRFAASDFLRLELLPKPMYHRRRAEAEFYEAYFEAVAVWAKDPAGIIQNALKLAVRYGLQAMDALHVAAAIAAGADEFITLEKRTKPVHRVREIKVVGR